MDKGLTIVLSVMFALGGFATFAPGVAAQADELAVTDPTGDASLYVGTSQTNAASPPQETEVPVAGELSGPADLTGFKVYGESATSISFELSVASFARPNTWQPSKLNHFLCFQWSGTGATYRFNYDLSYSTTPQSEVNSYPKFQMGYFDRVPECTPWDSSGARLQEARAVSEQFHVEYLPDEAKITWTIPRKLFETLNPAASEEGTLDPRPAAGDTLSNIQAHAVTMTTSGYTTYDKTDPPAEYAFQFDTGNEKVKVVVPNNIRAGAGVGGFDTPIYGVEIGSFQTVPVTIENHLATPIEPNLTVTIIAGEPGKWEVRTLPSIPVPKMVGETPGSATVTLIVNSDPTVSHKESIRLLVTALDQSQPEHLGAQAVDIVAVDPPTVGTSTLYFHGTGDPCGRNHRWLNTLGSDATATGEELPFQSCDPQGGGAEALVGGAFGYLFTPDVPFARDYTLSTTETAKASIELRSVNQIPGSDQEVGVPMVGDVTVQLLAGSTVIGEMTEEGVDIPGTPKAISVEVPIEGRILGGFGRDVPNDKGLGIRVSVTTASRTVELGGCVQDQCTPERTEKIPSPSGKVYMTFGKSMISLPIVASERSGDIINITKSGALMSLRLSEGEKHVFTNPARIVVFNLTVRNEGVNVDTARISAELNQTGWKAEILPTTSYKLNVGQPRSFNVRVTAPADAVEGQTLLLNLYARSTVDEAAVAKLPLTIEVTTGQQFEDQEIDERLQAMDEAEESPAPPLALLVLAALALLGVARSRRRHA